MKKHNHHFAAAFCPSKIPQIIQQYPLGHIGGAQEANDDVGAPREEGRQQTVEDAQVRHSGGVQPRVISPAASKTWGF